MKKESVMSRMSQITTIGVWVLIAAWLVLPLVTNILSGAEENARVLYYAMIVLVIVVLLVFRGLSPRSVEVGEGCLTIDRRWGSTIIPLNQIASVELFDTHRHSVGMRLCGSCGFYGFVGWFFARGRGIYKACAADYRDAFWVTTHSGKTYLFSCEDRDEVVTAIKPHQE